MTGPFKKLGPTLVKNGYSIIPIPLGSKGPKVADWQQIRIHTQAELEAFIAGTQDSDVKGKTVKVPNVREGDGVGILTTHTPAVDIDCLDSTIVEKMLQWCYDNLGDAPLRIGKAPKSLLLYAADKPFRKYTSARYYDPNNPDLDPKKKGQRLEILGEGQQFVAFHTHPETGKPYEWVNEWQDPLEIAALDLEVITAEHARLACLEFERLCEEAGWEKLGEGSASESGNADHPYDALAEILPPEETEAEVERVRSALKAIEGDIASTYDYDQWRNVLFALKWTRWDCAESLARAWSETSDKHNTKEFNTVWRGAQKRDRGREITLGSVFKIAKDAGWDASREPTAEDIKANFEALEEMVKALSSVDNTRVAVQEIIKKMATVTLTTASEGQILKGIKAATGDAIADMRRDLAKARKEHAKEESFMATHAGYALNMIERLEDKAGVRPVGVEGMIYTYSESKGIWKGTQVNDFSVKVAELFDGQENCSRRNDYIAIASHAYSILADGKESFFSDAPVGLACKGRFYRVNKEGQIEREELDSTHRQRVLSPVVPKVGPMPLFEKYLEDTFAGDDDDEQRLLLQEVMGAIMLGLMARFEKVVLLKGPGRSGKGTIMKIIEQLVPEDARSAVSPFNWDSEYYLANLAGKRLNVVGELPDDDPIPASYFKSVTGRDTMTGRHPSHRPFTFRNEAAHIFNTNHFVYTKDHSEAFYSRWVLMEFKNSRIGMEDAQIVTLAQDIIDSELPAIMAWGLQGAKRLRDRGYFPTTKVHTRMLAQWRHRTSTLLEFLLDRDACYLGDPSKVFCRRSEFYAHYVGWCKESNRRPMGKMKLYDELQALGGQVNVAMAVRDGYDVVLGVSFDSAAWFLMDDEDW